MVLPMLPSHITVLLFFISPHHTQLSPEFPHNMNKLKPGFRMALYMGL